MGYFGAFFTTAAALIDDLSPAFRAGELANAKRVAYVHGIPRSSWSMKWAISRTGPTPRTCSSMSSTSGIDDIAR